MAFIVHKEKTLTHCFTRRVALCEKSKAGSGQTTKDIMLHRVNRTFKSNLVSAVHALNTNINRGCLKRRRILNELKWCSAIGSRNKVANKFNTVKIDNCATEITTRLDSKSSAVYRPSIEYSNERNLAIFANEKCYADHQSFRRDVESSLSAE